MPSTRYLKVHSSRRPIGPRAWSFWVELKGGKVLIEALGMAEWIYGMEREKVYSICPSEVGLGMLNLEKPLPAPKDAAGQTHQWITGDVGANCIDSRDHTFAVTRGFQRGGIQGTDGTQYPDGSYTMTATAKDSSGSTVGVTTAVGGVVSSVDLTQSPPLLTINGQTYTVSQIQSIVD